MQFQPNLAQIEIQVCPKEGQWGGTVIAWIHWLHSEITFFRTTGPISEVLKFCTKHCFFKSRYYQNDEITLMTFTIFFFRTTGPILTKLCTARASMGKENSEKSHRLFQWEIIAKILWQHWSNLLLHEPHLNYLKTSLNKGDSDVFWWCAMELSSFQKWNIKITRITLKRF